MTTEGTGNIIEQEVDALVNTVNTVGVMGKGIALQFKRAFPDNFKQYASACSRNEVALGKMFLTHTGQLAPRLIINFPTKKHWRGSSRLEDIRLGLADLVKVVKEEGVNSIAIPPLGCGNGGLNWLEVKPLIEAAFEELPYIEVKLYSPWSGTPAIKPIVKGPKPNLTNWRASLITLLDAYSILAYEATHIEAQKLVYFLQVTGEPIDTNFVKGEYGPYDDGMKHGLLAMEGHYVSGFGEGRVKDSVHLVEGAQAEADAFLGDAPETRERIKRVAQLIEGFESPYGLELLATVHWVATHEDEQAKSDVKLAIVLCRNWNERKRQALKPDHIRTAWMRLSEHNWLQQP